MFLSEEEDCGLGGIGSGSCAKYQQVLKKRKHQRTKHQNIQILTPLQNKTKNCATVATKNDTICSLNWIEKYAAHFKIYQLKKEL